MQIIKNKTEAKLAMFTSKTKMLSYYETLQEINGVKLTPKEIDVVSCILNGRTSHKEIAVLLAVVPKVIESHKSNISNKLYSSRESNIRDFTEKSDKYDAIRLHYHRLGSIKISVY